MFFGLSFLRKLPVLVIAVAPLTVQAEPMQPPSTGGVGALHHLLNRLGTHRRLMVMGAHPDDEDTGLLTLVARGMGGESAYFSLSRGEGGQNLIGPELGEQLGLLRSHELLAARRTDGAHQFFSRAYDFGYTRSLEETHGFWPREALLEDAVRVVRRFRPQILVSVFPPSARGGHGQHQAAGVAAADVIEAAADAERFPELLEQGLPPWRPSAFYRTAFFRPAPSNLTLPSGGIDPETGKTYFQISMASRSMHRSQGMGTLQPLGPRAVRMEWIAGPQGDSDPFEPFETRLRGIAESLPSGPAKELLVANLAAVEERVAEAEAGLTPKGLSAVVGPLIGVLEGLRRAQASVRSEDVSESNRRIVEQLLEEKLELAQRALAIGSGWLFGATTTVGELIAGESTAVEIQFYNSGSEAVSVHPRIRLEATTERQSLEERQVEAGELANWSVDLAVPADAEPSVPYFLRRPRRGEMYDWTAADPATRGEPFEPPALTVTFDVKLRETEVELVKEVVHRFRDPAFGEIRRPVRVVPKVEIAVSPSSILWPASAAPTRTLQVVLQRHGSGAIEGEVEIEVPAGWPRIDAVPFAIQESEAELALQIALTRPPEPLDGVAEIRARAVVGAQTFDHSYPVIAYPHIRPVARPQAARIEVRSVDLELPAIRSVAYLRGASDRVPESLLEVGLPLKVVTAGELLRLDPEGLAAFDAIVVGSRAYETDAGLRELNPRLLEYVRRGGLLLVQYQQYQFSRGGFAPLSLEIRRPHDRITDQGSPVEILEPEHAAFLSPHRIGPADWEGWVQERGLYFAREWDPAYRPLLQLTDPDMPPQQGGLLIAELGDGFYVYTGLAFFRQLPAGVPGAYRLFMNLLNLASK